MLTGPGLCVVGVNVPLIGRTGNGRHATPRYATPRHAAPRHVAWIMPIAPHLPSEALLIVFSFSSAGPNVMRSNREPLENNNAAPWTRKAALLLGPTQRPGRCAAPRYAARAAGV